MVLTKTTISAVRSTKSSKRIFASCGVIHTRTLILLLILLYTTSKINACYGMYDPVSGAWRDPYRVLNPELWALSPCAGLHGRGIGRAAETRAGDANRFENRDGICEAGVRERKLTMSR